MDQLKEFEIALHQHETRTNIDKLKALLHPEFVEIGYSGTTWDFNSITDLLLAEESSDFKVWSQDYSYTEYAPNIIQVLYLCASLDKNGGLSRHAKRASIWVNELGKWKMKFHQATPITAFSKSNA